MPKHKITLSQLEGFLLKAADILRGKMDASEYKGLGMACNQNELFFSISFCSLSENF